MKIKNIAIICGVIVVLGISMFVYDKIREQHILYYYRVSLLTQHEQELEQKRAELVRQFREPDTVEYILPERFYLKSPIYQLDSVEASKYIGEFPDSIHDIKLGGKKRIRLKRGQVMSFSGFYHGSVGYTYESDYPKDAFSSLGILKMPNHVKYGCGDDKGTITLRFRADKLGKYFVSIHKIYRQDTINTTVYRINVLE